jgi:uncharacterized protein
VLDRVARGRTDLVFEYLSQGHAADTKDANGVSLMRWCAYYGSFSIREMRQPMHINQLGEPHV